MNLALLGTVLASSLLGSLHCAGMCGGFVAFYAGADETSGKRRALSHVAYNGGRLVAYGIVGGIAGMAGSVLNRVAVASGVGRVAGIAAGVVMLVWGLALLVTALGARLPFHVHAPSWLRDATVRVASGLRGRPPVVRAGLLGVTAALLPCGWLYAFVVVAGGTGSMVDGAFVMAAFWLGTVPVLLGIGVGVQSAAGRLRRHVPLLSAAALLVLGTLTVMSRFDIAPKALGKLEAKLSDERASGVPSAGHPPDCPMHAPKR